MDWFKIVSALTITLIVFIEGDAWTIRLNYRTEKVGSFKAPTLGSIYELRTARIHPLQIFYPYFPEKFDNEVSRGLEPTYENDTERLNPENLKILNNSASSSTDGLVTHPIFPPPTLEEDAERIPDSSSSSSSSSSESDSSSEEDDKIDDKIDTNNKENSSEEDSSSDESSSSESSSSHETVTSNHSEGVDEDEDENPENGEDANTSEDTNANLLGGEFGNPFQNLDFSEKFFANLINGLDFMEIASHVLEIIVEDEEEGSTTTTTEQPMSLTERESIPLQIEPTTPVPLTSTRRLTTTTTQTTTTTPTTTTTREPLIIVVDKGQSTTNDSQEGVSILEVFYPHSGIEIKTFAAGTTITFAFCALIILLWRLTKKREGKILQQKQAPAIITSYDSTKQPV